MSRKDLIFAAIIAAVVGIFIWLSAIGRKPQAMSARAEHAGLDRNTPRETCLLCHAPESKVAPMKPNHPKKGKPPDQMSCFACHKPPAPVVGAVSKSNPRAPSTVKKILRRI